MQYPMLYKNRVSAECESGNARTQKIQGEYKRNVLKNLMFIRKPKSSMLEILEFIKNTSSF